MKLLKKKKEIHSGQFKDYIIECTIGSTNSYNETVNTSGLEEF
jgi:hypothetical protein